MSNRLIASGTCLPSRRKILKTIGQRVSPFMSLSLLLVFYCAVPTRAQSSYTGDQSTSGSIAVSSGVAVGTLPPDSTIGALPTPMQGTVSPSVLASLGNVVTNLQGSTLIIDVSNQPSPGTFSYAGNFNNAGTTYLISTNPTTTTAVLQATSIFNQVGGTITTVLPSGGLAGYSNLVSNLSLSLIASNLIVNSGTISSAANLNIMAPQVINALPAGTTGPSPMMTAINNLNIVSSNLTNAGVLSAANNINITSQIASNILVNNVGGVLSALNGSVNIRDAAFVEKLNFALLGGDVLAKELNINTGEGILNLQVNNLTPALSVFAGEGYISALSDIHVATLQYSGDPILNSGGDIVFQGDQVPPDSGNYTLIATGSGTFSGRNAFIDPAHPATSINTTGLVLNLTGFVDLSGATISSTSGVSITAGNGITVGAISAPAGIKLNASSGNITAGNLTASANFVELQAASGSITSGALSAKSAVIVVSGKSFSAPSASVNGGGAVDIYVNQSTPFAIGGGGIGTIALTGTSPTGTGFVHIANTGSGGITLGSTTAISINTPFQQSYLALDAGTGVLTLPSGTISLDSSNFSVPAGVIALSAGQINANGTILSASNTTGGYAGVVVVGTSSLNGGAGLTARTNGAFGYTGVNGYGSVGITSTPGAPVDNLHVSFSGLDLQPITVTGQSLTLTSDGFQGQVILDGSTMNLSGNILLSANGGGGAAGYVQFVGNQIINNANVKATANGVGSESGGIVNVQSLGALSDLSLAENKLVAQATSGASGGDGGQLNIVAGHLLTVDTAAISAGVVGGQGNGGRVTLVGGTPGFAGGGVIFSNANASISADGQGSGQGGLVQIGAFGNGSNLILPSISANGGATGQGGWIDSTANNDITITGPLTARSGLAGDAYGGTVEINAGTNGTGSLLLTGDVSVEGSGSGGGGYLSLYGAGNTTIQNNKSQSVSLNAKGGSTGNGGIAIIGAGHSVTLTNAIIDASAGADGNGLGGYVDIYAGWVGSGNLTANASILANGSGDGFGGSVYLTSFTGSLTLNHPSSGVQSISATGGGNGGSNAADGGFIQVQTAGDLNLASGTIDVSSLSASGNGGTVVLAAGSGGLGKINFNQILTANSGITSGNGGLVTLSASSAQPITISGGIQADAFGKGDSGHIVYENRLETSALNVDISGTVSANTEDGIAASNEFRAINPNQNIVVNVLETGRISGPVTSKDGKSVKIEVRSTSPGQLTVGEIKSGDVTIKYNAGELKLLENSSISSTGNILLSTKTLDNAGLIETDGLNKTIKVTNDQSLEIKGDGLLKTTGGGSDSGIFFESGTGDIKVLTNSVNWSAKGGASSNDGGQISLSTTGNITFAGLLNPMLDVSGIDSGKGGSISIQAGKDLTLYGFLTADGSGNGLGGTVTLKGANVQTNGILEIAANAGNKGNGGNIFVSATNGNITMSNNAGSNFNVKGGTAEGHGGDVIFRASQDLTLLNAEISSSARGAGNGGGAVGVDIKAGGQLIFGGVINANGKGTGTDASGLTLGNGGLIKLEGNSVNVSPGISTSLSATTENATGGAVTVKVNNADLTANLFSTNVNALHSGTAGQINYIAPNGNVSVAGTINADGLETANGGAITIDAKSISSSGSIARLSAAASGSTGSGGEIKLVAKDADLKLGNGSTFAISFDVRGGSKSGEGGKISITNAGNLTVDGSAFTNSAARSEATVSELSLFAVPTTHNGTLTVKSAISVGNSQTGGRINLGAAHVVVEDNSSLTANGSSGGGLISIGGENLGTKALSVSIGKNVALSADANVTKGGYGGTVRISSSDSVTIESVTINVSGVEVTNGGIATVSTHGNLLIDAGGKLEIQDSLTGIALGGGTSTGISLNANNWLIPGTLQLDASGEASGSNPANGGRISLTSNGDLLVNHGAIIANSSTVGGTGGNVTITAAGKISLGVPIETKGISNPGSAVPSSTGGTVKINAGSSFTTSKEITASGNSGGTIELTYSASSSVIPSFNLRTSDAGGRISIVNTSPTNDLQFIDSTFTGQTIQLASASGIDGKASNFNGIVSTGKLITGGVLTGSTAKVNLESKSSFAVGKIEAAGNVRVAVPISPANELIIGGSSTIKSISGEVTLEAERIRNEGLVEGQTILMSATGASLILVGAGQYKAIAASNPSAIELRGNQVEIGSFFLGNGKVNFDVAATSGVRITGVSSTSGGKLILPILSSSLKTTSDLTLNNISSIESAGQIQVGGKFLWLGQTSDLRIKGGIINSTKDLTINTGGSLTLEGPGLGGIGTSINANASPLSLTASTITGDSSVNVSSTGAMTIKASSISGADYKGNSVLVNQNGAGALIVSSTIEATSGNAVIQHTSSGRIEINGGSVKATGGSGRVYVLSAASAPNDSSLQEQTSASLFPIIVSPTSTGKVYFGSAVKPLTASSTGLFFINGSGIIFDGAVDSITLNQTTLSASGPAIITTTSSLPPGLGGTPPGQGGNTFGLGTVLPPGLGGANPAFTGQPPGLIAQNPHQSGSVPPGKLKAKVDQDRDQNKTLIATTPKSVFKPVALTQVARLPGRQELLVKCLTSPASNALMVDGSEVEYLSENSQVLHDGEVLIHCFTSNSMDCGDYKVKMSPGSVVLAAKDKDTVRVTVLHDSGRGAVSVISNAGEKIEVVAGEEVIIGTLAHHYPRQGRRRISNHYFNNGDNVSLREFSLISLSVQNEIVAHVLSNRKDQLSGKLFKTAACLDLVRKNHGPYH